jgi:predicted acetyltransferase
MRAAMVQGIDAGNALRVLFATTTKLYRGLGWDLAGSFNFYRVDARQVPPVGPPMRPLTEEDWPAVERADDAWRRTLNGPAVRLEQDWAPLRRARFGYGLDAAETGELEAYVLYDVAHDLGEYWYYSLNLLDWAATTPRGLEAVLGFIGRHGTMGKRAMFKGPVPHPWAYLAPEQDVERVGGGTWLVRPLDVRRAIIQRGYAMGLSVDVTFALNDVEIPHNSGPWRLRIDDGRGELTSASSAEVEMDVRAFGPLFTGYTGIEQLRLAGLVRGGSPGLAALGAAFAGPAPVMLEFF